MKLLVMKSLMPAQNSDWDDVRHVIIVGGNEFGSIELGFDFGALGLILSPYSSVEPDISCR